MEPWRPTVESALLVPFFQNPLGLAALLALPAILGLHLFRRRFRPAVISALFLWDTAATSTAAGRRREKLYRSPSLWLELCAALALAIALAGPRAACVGESEHLIAVLDDSASMNARPASEASFAERARSELRERLERLPRGSRVTIIKSGLRPRILVGPAALPDDAAAALESWSPAAPRHDEAPAVALALELAGGGEERAHGVVFVTDHYLPERLPETVEVVAVGRPLDNAAIAHVARARAEGERESVFASVVQRGVAALETTLALYAGDTALVSVPVRIEPGERRDFELELPADESGGRPGEPWAGQVLELRLGADALATDNRAWVAPAPARTVALATTISDDTARRLGVWSGEPEASRIDRWLDVVPGTTLAPAPELAHIVLRSEQAPALASHSWSLTLAEIDGEDRRDWIGPFLTEKRHALLEGLTLDGIVWSAEPGRELPGAPLVSAGREALLTEVLSERSAARNYLLNLDAQRSTLARSPDWPILLANLVELRRSELPGPERSNLAIGESLVWRDDSPGTYLLQRVGADGEAAPIELAAQTTLVVDDVREAGVWVLEREGAELARFAYSFLDLAESDLSGASSGRRPGVENQASLATAFGWLECLLVLVVLGCCLADWAWLGRRREVDA